MIKTLLKHSLYEIALNQFFSAIQFNFMNSHRKCSGNEITADMNDTWVIITHLGTVDRIPCKLKLTPMLGYAAVDANNQFMGWIEPEHIIYY